MTSQFDSNNNNNNNNQLIFQMSGVEITTTPFISTTSIDSWLTSSPHQRPTATKPIDIPPPKKHHTHTFDRIEAIFI
jgi:hypothetical protein